MKFHRFKKPKGFSSGHRAKVTEQRALKNLDPTVLDNQFKLMWAISDGELLIEDLPASTQFALVQAMSTNADLCRAVGIPPEPSVALPEGSS